MARRGSTVADQYSAGSNYIARGGILPGQGDSLGLMATSPGLGDTGAWSTGGEIGPDDGMGGGGMGGWAGSDYDGSDYSASGDSYDDDGDGGGGGYDDSDYDDSYDGGSGGGMSAARSSGGDPSSDLPPGNILVGFAVTAGFFVGVGFLFHHLGGAAAEKKVGDVSPSLVNAMKIGVAATLTVPLVRAGIGQLAYWQVPFAADASAYVNGA